MTILMTRDLVACPHCHRNQEDSPVEDFVVPSRLDTPCMEECCWCQEPFYVTQLTRDTYQVTAKRPQTVDDILGVPSISYDGHVLTYLLWHLHRDKGGTLEEWYSLGRCWIMEA